jgi:CRP/FNR family transcriptional regulator
MSDFWHTSDFDWMADLSKTDTDRFRSRCGWREYARGETVFEPTADPQSVYLLETGLVRIYRLSRHGAEVTLGYIPTGKVFGEVEVFSDGPRESFAQVVLPARVWQIPRAELQRLLGTYPRIAVRIAEQMGNRFKRIENRVENLALSSLRSRIGLILLELAEDFGHADADGLRIDLPLSQYDIARLVGATRQSVNHDLRELREAKLLVYRNRRFTLPDPVALRAAMQG